MNINHENKILSIPRRDCMYGVVSAAPPLVSDITISVNHIMTAPATHSVGIFPVSDICSYCFLTRQDSATVQRTIQKSKIMGGSGFGTDTGKK